MTSYPVLVFFSYSILLAAVVGFLRYQKVTPGDRPFFYIVWVALLNEILSEIFAATTHSTAMNCNVYVLVEALLYCWLFYNWGSGLRSKNVFKALVLFICLVWILDNLILNKLSHTNSLFRIISSFILVFLAIDRVNLLITTERSKLLTNAHFLISTGVIIFFTYRAIIEVFYLIHMPFSNTFYLNVYVIMDYVNLFVNLIFALAALWIPTRQKFILPS
jgi:hypothetical protein